MEAIEERLGGQISKAQRQVDWICEKGLPMIEGKLIGFHPETLIDLSEKYQKLSEELQLQASRTADIVDARVEKCWQSKQDDLTATIKGFETKLSQKAAQPRFASLEKGKIADESLWTLTTRVEAIERQFARRHVVFSSASSAVGESASPSPRRGGAGVRSVEDSPCEVASLPAAGAADVKDDNFNMRLRLLSSAKDCLEARASRTEGCLAQLAVKLGELADVVHSKADRKRSDQELPSQQSGSATDRACDRKRRLQHEHEQEPTAGADVLVAVRHLDELSQVVQGLSDELERVVQDVAEERKASESFRRAHDSLDTTVQGMGLVQAQTSGVGTTSSGGGAIAYAVRGLHEEIADLRRNVGNLQAGLLMVGAGLGRELPETLGDADLAAVLHRT